MSSAHIMGEIERKKNIKRGETEKKATAWKSTSTFVSPNAAIVPLAALSKM